MHKASKNARATWARKINGKIVFIRTEHKGA